ncbi:MAG: sodium:proton antiporter [Acidobacteria bacterium]|nr:MAG: sodium:proton antiporter [Acidobacteriota bacterium]
MSLSLAFLVALMVSAGLYLAMQRSLTRIVLGFGLLTHAANLTLIARGASLGRAPIINGTWVAVAISDPLPQAFVLTAIVISFGLTVFALGLAYRALILKGNDEVEDDLEDRRIARLRGERDRDLDQLGDELDLLEEDDERGET